MISLLSTIFTTFFFMLQVPGERSCLQATLRMCAPAWDKTGNDYPINTELNQLNASVVENIVKADGLEDEILG